MRKRSISIICLILAVFLSACSPNEEDNDTQIVLTETNKGEYAYIIPFVSTDTRSYHGTYQSRHDINEIGVGLEEYSKAYFAPAEYYVQEGVVIDINTLLNLVARESDTNTQGLNPSKGSSFLTGNEDERVVDPVIVTDVFELDFIKKKNTELTIDGITLAMIVNKNQRVTIDGSVVNYTLTEYSLWEYASNAGRKLESYLRTLDGIANMPIYILIYSTASSDETLPGGYIGGGYFTGRSGQFARFSEKWVLMPTIEGSQIDSDTYNKLLNMKRAVLEFLPESVNIIAEAKYVDNVPTLLKIKLRAQGKTYAEIRALTQYCVQLIRDFNNDMRILVTIDSNDEIVAIIERAIESNEVLTTYIN